jgi:hypothetical protein
MRRYLRGSKAKANSASKKDMNLTRFNGHTSIT